MTEEERLYLSDAVGGIAGLARFLSVEVFGQDFASDPALLIPLRLKKAGQKKTDTALVVAALSLAGSMLKNWCERHEPRGPRLWKGDGSCDSN